MHGEAYEASILLSENSMERPSILQNNNVETPQNSLKMCHCNSNFCIKHTNKTRFPHYID